jgi:hypothetical protein
MKRRLNSNQSTLPSAAKKQHLKVEPVISAESSVSAETQAHPNLVQSHPTAPMTPKKPATQRILVHPTTPITSTGSNTPPASSQHTLNSPSPHYRSHTYHPVFSSPLLAHPTQPSPGVQGCILHETGSLPGSQSAWAIGTIRIQSTKHHPSTPLPPTPATAPNSQPALLHHPSLTFKNPKARKDYYREHLWKE